MVNSANDIMQFSSLMLSPIPDEVAATLVKDLIYSLEYAGGDNLSLSNPDSLWNYTPQRNIASINLWIKSLSFLNPLLNSYSENPTQRIYYCITAIIESYLQIQDQLLSSQCKMSSKDHLIASSTVMLLRVLHVFGKEWKLRNQTEKLLIDMGDYMYGDSLWTPGNHGVMVDLALLHLAVYLSSKRGECYRMKALSRVQNQAAEVFDKDGFCNENSVGYFDYNFRLYSLIVDFCKYHDIRSNEIALIQKVLRKARTALACAVLPDGKTPLIGDSGLDKTAYSSKQGMHLFREAGFFFYKTKNAYFSYNCGYSSPIHKHCDENSITMQFKGRDIFVDSGYFNYDIKDPIRVFVAGTRGHTSIFPIPMDTLSVSDYLQEISSAGIDECELSKTGFDISGSITFVNGLRITRRIKGGGKNFVINDSWENASDDMRQRFILHPDSKIEVKKTTTDIFLSIKNAGVLVTMRIPLEKGISVHFSKGYYSEHYNEFRETRAIDVLAKHLSQGTIKVEITAEASTV
jgi:hypothetical protein